MQSFELLRSRPLAMNPLDGISAHGFEVASARMFDALHIFASDLHKREALALAYLRRKRPLAHRIKRVLIGSYARHAGQGCTDRACVSADMLRRLQK
jgi:hypothetical protein